MLAIALLPPSADLNLAGLAFAGILGEGWTVRAFTSAGDVPDDVCAEAEFVIAAPVCEVDAVFIKRAPKLRLIQLTGHGYDLVDVEAARAAGIPLATIASSGAEAHTVAELALVLAAVASRRVMQGDRFVREGRWGSLEMLQGGIFELAGKTLGIVGFGRIGRELNTRAIAFGMRVIYYDVVKPSGDAGATFAELDDLLAQSDVISLHAPLTSQTRGMIGERALSLVKPTAVLVNTARGPLVDAAALANALKDGRLRAAAIDVFDPEPPTKDNPLLGLDNVVLSPHMAGVTAESVLRILAAALENCRRVAQGEEPHDVVHE